MKINYWLLILLLSLSLLSCQPTKVLQDGERLYSGAEIEYLGQAPKVSKSALMQQLRQAPNSKFFGMAVRLGIYAKYAEQEKGLGKWIRDKLGEPPALFQYQKAEASRLSMEKHLIDQGYLRSSVAFDTLLKHRRRVSLLYQVEAGPRYELRSVNWPTDSNRIGRFIQQQRSGSFLQAGEAYQTELLKAERSRLARAGREQGFYGLSADQFYYFLDTTSGQHQVEAYLRLAEQPRGNPYQPHYIGHTTLYPVHFLEEDNRQAAPDTLQFSDFRFVQPREFVDPGTLRRAILQNYGDLFALSRQQRSVNRLLGLGAYKFVDLKYQLREQDDSLFLDRYFYLTPALTQDFSAEIGTSTLSTASSSLNLGLQLNYTHRNIFGGSERLNLGFSADAATQLGREVDFINSVNLSLRGELSFPDFVVPFNLFRSSKAWQARTNASLRGDFQRRTNFFSLTSVKATYGYEWQPGRLQRYQWNPIQLSRVNLLNSSEAFEQRLQDNPRLRESFNDYFIASMGFQFDYSEQEPEKRENYLAARVALEAAGNVAYGAYALSGASGDRAYELLGLPFAQFARVDAGLQYHLYQGRSEWASRLNIGLALPYGNSNAIPYVRQFFVGGSNSIRAWQIRALGPGASAVEALNAEIFQDQTGDIKLEANLEYRFPLFSYLRGALFADAGNIWLTKQEDIEQAPEAVFSFDDFYRQIAVGTGFGLRLDVTYFVLRLDLAFPIRKPYQAAGERWVFDELRFGSAGWREENLVYNLALGYPF